MDYNAIEELNSLLTDEQKRIVKRKQSEAKYSSRPVNCRICGKEISHHCNSHSVPKFVLNHIKSANGMVSTINDFIELDIIKKQNGVQKEAGTFKQICSDCDNHFFKDYESNEALENEPTQKMMAEIAVKNILAMIEDYEAAMALLEPMSNIFFYPVLNFKRIDTDNLITELSEHISVANTPGVTYYFLLFFIRLPHQIPFAFQGAFTPERDFEGNLLNDIYSRDESEVMKMIHVVAFPTDNGSTVFAFCRKKDRLFKRFRQQFKSLSDPEILEYINYLIASSSEHCLYNPDTANKLKENEAFKKLAGEVNECANLFDGGFNFNYSPVNSSDIPNLFNQEWALTRVETE